MLLVADLLCGRAHDRRSLAERLGIRPPMADRLINAALEHVPGVIEERAGKTRTIRFDPSRAGRLPSYPTAIAACFGASLWPLFEGSAYQNGIRDARLEVVGRTKRRAPFKDLDRKFWFLRRGGEAALLQRSALLDELVDAVLHHRVTLLEYERVGGTTGNARIEPLSIVLHQHQLYVVARTADEWRKLRTYRFARLRGVEVTEATFIYPSTAEYDPRQTFRHSFGIFVGAPIEDVELQLSREWAVYARTHRWHESQVLDDRVDHVRVRLHVGVCPELEAWILGFGEDAEVLAPASLRERIAARATSMAATYSAKLSPPAAVSLPAVRKADASRPSEQRAIRRRG